MRMAALMLGLCLPLAACLANGPAVDAPAVRQGRAVAGGDYPVRVDGGYLYGGQRRAPDRCGVPWERRLKGAPLTEAVMQSWPQRFFADVAVMQAALAGVAYPGEVAYLEMCIGVDVVGAQVPGQMPRKPGPAPSSVIWSQTPF